MTEDNLDLSVLEALDAEFDDDVDLAQTYTHEMMLRRFIWSIVPCELALDVMERYPDLPRVSEEVEQREHDEGHQRLEDLGVPLSNVIAYFAAQVSSVIAETNIVQAGENEELVEHFRELFNPEDFIPVMFAGIRSVIAEMIDIGLLHIGPAPFSTGEVDDEDEEEA